MVVVMAIVFLSYSTIRKINVDIFPRVELPAIYVAMPYGGLSPAYMDGFMANQFQKILLFVSGVKSIDFHSIQGLTIMKLTFYPRTNMSQVAGELSTSVSRAMGFLPPGAVPPMVVRFDGSSLPVGDLVFESNQRSINQIQNLVLTRIRPMFVGIPGVTAPAPFGGNERTIVVNVNPQAMQANGLSPQDIIQAITKNNLPSPAGNVQIGSTNFMAPINSIVKDPETFLNIPIKTIGNRTIYIKDVADVEDAADQTVGYAIINGKRSVFLPVIKKAGASTLEVVKDLKAALPKLQNQLPPDVKIRYEFDQSKHIKHSLANLIHEGIMGAFFTGFMILLFLGDTRGALIVILTIPTAILTAVTVLFLFGQTINIMTLSGLALSIGILVDEATVTIENIHQHLEMGKPKSRAIVDAALEISVPKLLILLSTLAVLTPAFIMTGLPKDMFMPLSMAVAFAMIASFLASQTFVPVLANWILKIKTRGTGNAVRKRSPFEKFKVKYSYGLRKWFSKSLFLFILYLIVAGGIVTVLLGKVGTDVMPASNSGDFQMRIDAPEGSRIEETGSDVKGIVQGIRDLLPPKAVSITLAYVGLQPASTPINAIFFFTSSSGEAVLQVSINQKIYKGSMESLKEKIRKMIMKDYPQVAFNFEPMNLTEKIMSQGAMTPIEVKVGAVQVDRAYAFATRVENNLKQIPFLRDVRIVEQMSYPTLDINVNRNLAGQFGLTMQDITHSLVTATSSTRFTDKNYWIDPKSGLAFQVQVQIPTSVMSSEEMLRSLPLKPGSARPLLEDVATIQRVTSPAQINRKGPDRYVTIVANVYRKDLGTASRAVQNAIRDSGTPPRGVIVWTEGMIQLLKETLSRLLAGLSVAIIAIFLMLSAYYQSFKVPLIILSVVPAIIAGSLLVLFLTGSTLNLESYMGIIMSIGVSVSNTVLLVDQAEFYRRHLFLNAANAARLAASSRLRPILMTAAAMVAGMIPMAIGFGGEGGQAAPLGRAVIGGLIASAITILFLVPHFFSSMLKKSKAVNPSLDPDDHESRYFSNKK